MNKSFVPFLASAPAVSSTETGSASKKTADPKSAKAFRLVADGACPSGPAVAGEPKVTVERDGDRVTRIRIQCGCGHTTELACEY